MGWKQNWRSQSRVFKYSTRSSIPPTLHTLRAQRLDLPAPANQQLQVGGVTGHFSKTLAPYLPTILKHFLKAVDATDSLVVSQLVLVSLHPESL